MSWTDVFPVFSDEQIDDYRAGVTPEEQAMLDEWCGVARTINSRAGKHLVAATLFWKNSTNHEGELPPVTREMMKDAARLGLVSRYAPWEHYVQPMLDGAAALREARPDVVFRIYLAADLEFLVEDFVEVGCEVMLMCGSSIRHNPGALWRFLALEEAGRWITVTDADRCREVLHDIERTEHIIEAGIGAWRVPYLFDSVHNADHPGYYRPMNACQFGTVGGYPISSIMRAFLWHTVRGTIANTCRVGGPNGGGKELPIYGTDWPTYGFDEWFLIAAIYPRLAPGGVLTFMRWDKPQTNQWLALDIEYVTWASPKSEIFFFGGEQGDAADESCGCGQEDQTAGAAGLAARK